MLTRFHLILFLLVVLCSGVRAAPVDLSTPSNRFDCVTEQGYVHYWRNVVEVEFGKDLNLPLRFKFASENQSSSPYLGKGWTCPLFESNVVATDSYTFRVTLLCGKTMYMHRKAKSDVTFFSADNEWKGQTAGNEFLVSRADGWKLRFIDGHLATRFAYLDDHLSRNDYLLESGFSVADAYLFNILTWSHRVNVDLSAYPAIRRFMARMGERPTIRASLEAEGVMLG